ncbi:hypothetical protein BGW80DRAFT_423542 [Lactifluus volemus]|nr:hypothetical protein BGW80DRAFT_423542 [Lactifluus volemus]
MELVELLADVDVDGICQERKMAKTNCTKYVGTGNDGSSFRWRRALRRVRKVNAWGVTVATMDGARTIMIERLERAAAGSEILLRGGPTLRSTMLAMMRHHAHHPTTTRVTSLTVQSTRLSTTQSKTAGKAPEPVPAPVVTYSIWMTCYLFIVTDINMPT